ncbi:MAG: hypothetical protein R2828_01410 [Saprospiraceae bacterium]
MTLAETSNCPGENFITHSTAREQLMKELTPDLADDEEIIQQINNYVFSEVGENKRQQLRRTLEQTIRKKSPSTNACNMDLVMTMIDGMLYAISHFDLKNNSELDNWLHLHKMATMSTLSTSTLTKLAEKKELKEQEARFSTNGQRSIVKKFTIS